MDLTSSFIKSQKNPVGHKQAQLYGAMLKTPEGKLVVDAQKSLRSSIAWDKEMKTFMSEKYKSLDSSKRARLVTNEVMSRSRSVISGNVDNIFKKSITEFTTKVKDKHGVQFYKDEIGMLKNSYNYNSKFLGKTANERLRLIQRSTQKDISKIYSNPKISEEAKRKSVQEYISGKNYGANSFRPHARITVSEMYRARQEAGRLTGSYLESLGYTIKYIWRLSTLPGRKKDICDKYAAKKHYILKTLPGYPHSFCACHVEPIIIKGPEEGIPKVYIQPKNAFERTVNFIQDKLGTVNNVLNRVERASNWALDVAKIIDDPRNVKNYFNFSRDTLSFLSDRFEFAARAVDILDRAEGIRQAVKTTYEKGKSIHSWFKSKAYTKEDMLDLINVYKYFKRNFLKKASVFKKQLPAQDIIFVNEVIDKADDFVGMFKYNYDAVDYLYL